MTILPHSLPGPGFNALDTARLYHQHDYAPIPLCSPSTAHKHGKEACTSPGKVPITPKWQRFAHNQTRADIDALFSSHEGNVGLAVKPRRVVIDIDPRNGGNDSWAELQAENNDYIDDTPQVYTGGDGMHYYFTLPDGVTVKGGGTLADYPGIDWKSVGGQVVAPPSIHASGNPYFWEADSSPDDLDEQPIRPWLLEKIQGNPSTSRAVIHREAKAIKKTDHAFQHGMGRERRVALITGVLQKGSRNSGIASLAGQHLRKKVCNAKLINELLSVWFDDHVEQALDDPISYESAVETINGIYRQYAPQHSDVVVHNDISQCSCSPNAFLTESLTLLGKIVSIDDVKEATEQTLRNVARKALIDASRLRLATGVEAPISSQLTLGVVLVAYGSAQEGREYAVPVVGQSALSHERYEGLLVEQYGEPVEAVQTGMFPKPKTIVELVKQCGMWATRTCEASAHQFGRYTTSCSQRGCPDSMPRIARTIADASLPGAPDEKTTKRVAVTLAVNVANKKLRVTNLKQAYKDAGDAVKSLRQRVAYRDNVLNRSTWAVLAHPVTYITLNVDIWAESDAEAEEAGAYLAKRLATYSPVVEDVMTFDAVEHWQGQLIDDTQYELAGVLDCLAAPDLLAAWMLARKGRDIITFFKPVRDAIKAARERAAEVEKCPIDGSKIRSVLDKPEVLVNDGVTPIQGEFFDTGPPSHRNIYDDADGRVA